MNLIEVSSPAEALGEMYLCGRTVEEAAADEWRLKGHPVALQVL